MNVKSEMIFLKRIFNICILIIFTTIVFAVASLIIQKFVIKEPDYEQVELALYGFKKYIEEKKAWHNYNFIVKK